MPFAAVVEGWSSFGSVRLHSVPTLLLMRSWSPGSRAKHQPWGLWWNVNCLNMAPHGPGKTTKALEAMINPRLDWFVVWSLAWSCNLGGNSLDLETTAVSSVAKNDHHRRGLLQLCTYRHACSCWYLAFIQIVPSSLYLVCHWQAGWWKLRLLDLSHQSERLSFALSCSLVPHPLIYPENNPYH